MKALINNSFGMAELDINQKGKRISSINTGFGFSSREIIKTALETKDPIKMIPYIERIEQSSHNHYSTCFCMLLEKLCNIEPEEAVKAIRTLILEFERIYSHSIYLNRMFSYTDNNILINDTLSIHDKILDCFEEIIGHRMYGTCSVLGDVNFNISSGNIKLIKEISEELALLLNKIKVFSKNNHSLLSMFKEQALISETMIKENNLSGPFSWFYDESLDLRKKETYLSYGRTEIQEILDNNSNTENCIYGRIMRIIDDSENSIRIIRVLSRDGDNIIYNRKQPLRYLAEISKGKHSQTIESPRGSIKITVETNKAGSFEKMDIISPSDVNSAIIERAIKGNIIDCTAQAFDSLYLSSMEIDK